MKSGVEKKSDSAKWLVIGAVIVIFILVFQSQIGRFLDRTTEITIFDKVKIKTMETPLGETEVSKVLVKTESDLKEGIQGTTYTSVSAT